MGTRLAVLFHDDGQCTHPSENTHRSLITRPITTLLFISLLESRRHWFSNFLKKTPRSKQQKNLYSFLLVIKNAVSIEKKILQTRVQ